MLFHLSIEADDPRGVAEALAEIWGGAAVPFPPVGIGSWAAVACDEHGSMVEVYQRGTELHEGADGAFGRQFAPHRHTATHFAMATKLDAEAVMAIAKRRGWASKCCRRADRFGVIEIWVEGCALVEVLTPEMQREYLATMGSDLSTLTPAARAA
jgi:hypothetical protein